MNTLPTRVLGGVVLLLTTLACSKNKEVYTVVEGTITNKYTAQPVAGIRLEVDRTQGCWLCMGSRIDSVTNAITDASGNYKVAFNALTTGSYSLRPASTPDYMVSSFELGEDVKAGQHNQIDYKATPYKTVTIRANTTKKGKSDIYFTFISGNQTGETGIFNGDIFTDMDKKNQAISFTKTIKVLPDRVYQFTKVTSNRVCQPDGYTCTFQDQESEVRTRDIRFTNDTATVSFQ
ncbi:carboxypeptidase-like regulatory domain-containing protein [Hymenobacter cellulosilyticus]|uniref:Carboxypeptidase-like regulatory domain-containing protein n=1 Tax=Hymenobacter cellulosilyticus TaxID=2932248 RepID=A0A8T9PXG0_9BACT|nr:carboxypeptidase-like regulatory domain-containing protein [Hymenobacter cellulosilyticus]UOQ70066.1 carboxypeptidase-like regulatory domain-containing protein [Hymenobacter cellulosilyticus]